MCVTGVGLVQRTVSFRRMSLIDGSHVFELVALTEKESAKAKPDNAATHTTKGTMTIQRRPVTIT